MVKVEKQVFLNIGRRDILITQILNYILIVSICMLFATRPSFEVVGEGRIFLTENIFQGLCSVDF